MKVLANHGLADIVTTSPKQCYGMLNRMWSVLSCRTWPLLTTLLVVNDYFRNQWFVTTLLVTMVHVLICVVLPQERNTFRPTAHHLKWSSYRLPTVCASVTRR